MAKGIRATLKQAVAGRRNVVKAQVSRIGLRGQHYRKLGKNY
jgi:hypothetical protein